MRKFKLLKDLPNIKKGSISNDMNEFDTWVEFYDQYNKYIDNWKLEIVENNPDWFEEIKEDEDFHKQHEASILHYIESKEEPKKTVRRWLWDHKEDTRFWILNNYWFSEQEAENHYKSFGIQDYKKTILNGQEAYRDFEE